MELAATAPKPGQHFAVQPPSSDREAVATCRTCHRSRSLPIHLLDRSQIHRPGQRRAAPLLTRRCGKLTALIEAADPQPIGRWVWLDRRSIDRRAAFRAECMDPPVPAL